MTQTSRADVGLNQTFFDWVLGTRPRGLSRRGGEDKGWEDISHCEDSGFPGPLVATIQLYPYLIYMLTFSCRISFKERVCGEGKKKEADDL